MKKKNGKLRKNLPNLKLASLIISGEGEALTTKTLATDTKIITLNVELMFILIRVRLDFTTALDPMPKIVFIQEPASAVR